jgi:hypothetical protein
VTDPDQFDDADELFANLPEIVRENGRSRRRQAFILAFVTVIGLTGGVLLQRQASAIQASTDADRKTLAITRATAFEQCKLVNDNARALNGLIDTVILRLRASDDLAPAEKKAAIALYASSKQSLPRCEAP